ncbi:MAG: permease prefix domain 1-containing protein, partial [Gemmatimonadales bacterium]
MRSIFDSLRRSRRQVEAEIHEELEFHLASRGAELVAGGMSPDAARSVALGEFGDLSGTREYCLSQGAAMERGREWGERVTDFGHDLRVTMRGLGRRPAFTILAVVMLALGIGGSAAFWT